MALGSGRRVRAVAKSHLRERATPLGSPLPRRAWGRGEPGVVARFVFVLSILCLQFAHSPSRAQAESALPAPLCALVAARVICYDARTAAPAPVSPADTPVIDFTIAPDGGWVAYRTTEALWIVPIDGHTAAWNADPLAAPPAALDPAITTLTWSPDGLGIAYVTAAGLRIAWPGGHFAAAIDRAYTRVLWSPSGVRLAAKSADGEWTFFAPDRAGSLRITRVFATAADAAWLTDDAVIIAPTAGGLLRLNPASASAPPDWYVADEHFIRLERGAPGEVVALHPDPGDSVGGAVSIAADGKWHALGSAKLDARLTWLPAPAAKLLYITSGTPILVDPATGAEDMLPIRRIDRIVWSPAPPPEVLGVAMDADLYFLAADSSGIVQVWRLPRDGFPLIELSRSVISVTDFTVAGALIWYTAGGVTAIVAPDGPPASTPTPAGLPRTPFPTRLPPTIPPSPPPVTASASVNFQNIGWQPGPSVIQIAGTAATTVLERPLFSPSGHFAVGYRGARLLIVNWQTGRQVTVQGVIAAGDLRWVS